MTAPFFLSLRAQRSNLAPYWLLLSGFSGFDAVIIDRDPPMDAVFLRRVVAGGFVI
jgi:hypothetical protein